MRRAIDTLALLFALGVVAEGWLTPGLIFPTVVSSASMAPRLRGPCWIVACPSCGLKFAIDREQGAPLDSTACPNCANAAPLAGARAKNGDRILIDAMSFALAAPPRWASVVVADPAGSGELLVKRIVGLPRETIDIQDGDVFANGRRARKSLDDLRRLAIPVHDDRHRPADAQGRPISRWRPRSPHSTWIQEPDGWRVEPQHEPKVRAAAPELDWLIYRHRSSTEWRTDSSPESPVTDDYAYNAAESQRLTPVRDLMLRCRLQAREKQRLAIWISNGRDAFCCLLEIGAGQRAVASVTPAPLDAPASPQDLSIEAPPAGEPAFVCLEFAQVDGQLLLAIDGESALRHEYDPSAASGDPPSAPIAIASLMGASIRIADLEVLRDIHYLPSAAGTGATRLAADEYFLLGDNCPRSLDSRYWNPPGVSRDAFVGRVAGRLASDRDAW